MCDTFVYVPSEPGEPVIFGKNSDREPNEAQQIVRYAAHIRDGKVNATYIPVDARREVNEVILSKPFQMWGAEMGVNTHGVAIGNEAVFTKIPFIKKNTGLTGMDMVRLGLEGGGSAEEALQIIIDYLEKYGQNACGGYLDKKFFYHNSFILADSNSAYVLETAGPYWAYKKVSGYRAISNGLSLGEDYDSIAKGAIDFARSKRWISKNKAFNFRKAFSAFWMPRLASCDARRSLSEHTASGVNAWSANDAFRILRTHDEPDFNPAYSNTGSLCMHASGLTCPHQTTGSMVAELRQEKPSTVWLTGSSAPCLSIFKPFYFGSNVLDTDRFEPPQAQTNSSYWWRWEAFHREAVHQYQAIIRDVRNDQRLLETMWMEKDAELIEGSASIREAFSRQCVEDSITTLETWKAGVVNGQNKMFQFLYRRFWNRQNKHVNI